MSKILKVKLPNNEVRDLGALSSNVIYDGDAGVTTTLNDKIQSIFTTLGDINSFEVAVTPTLPTTTIDDHTIYFIPNEDDNTVKDEYMYVGGQWELIGSTSVDLTDYVQYTDLASVATSGDYEDLLNVPTIPAATTVTVTQTQSSGTEIGKISVNSVTTTLYAPTIITYSLSMSGNTITLMPSSGTASTITLPVYDGTIV